MLCDVKCSRISAAHPFVSIKIPPASWIRILLPIQLASQGGWVCSIVALAAHANSSRVESDAHLSVRLQHNDTTHDDDVTTTDSMIHVPVLRYRSCLPVLVFLHLVRYHA
jgi:hypothetical protein